MKRRGPEVPPAIIARLRAICLALPEAREEPAWAGTRWCIRKANFAQVLMIASGWPPAYARAAGSAGPLCVLTFRSPLPALDAYAYTWEPFFRPPWFPDIVGLRLGAANDCTDLIDWDEVTGVLRASYRMLAPRKLAEQFDSGNA